MTVWFTSDTHYGHAKMVTPSDDPRYKPRPFASVEEMDEALIARWNAAVKPGDSVYHLGDFGLCRTEHAVAIAKRLRGQKFLIFGNHDKRVRKDIAFLGNWVWARDMAEIKVGDQKITLLHYAMRTWASSHYGSWQLFGHSHGNLKNPSMRSVDVGVDCWNYAPVAFETLRDVIAQHQWTPVDHHGELGADE